MVVIMSIIFFPFHAYWVNKKSPFIAFDIEIVDGCFMKIWRISITF